MFGSICKKQLVEKDNIPAKDIVMVSVMPCTAKKYEAARDDRITSYNVCYTKLLRFSVEIAECKPAAVGSNEQISILEVWRRRVNQLYLARPLIKVAGYSYNFV